MKNFTFYKENRIDGAFTISGKQLQDTFAEWFVTSPNRKLMFETYSKERIVQCFLKVAGAFDNSEYKEIINLLKAITLLKDGALYRTGE